MESGLSLLDKGNETLVIYPQVSRLDADGNKVNYADKDNPITVRGVVQLKAQSGTSARRSEQDDEGYASEEMYRVRLTRADTERVVDILPQAQIVWAGQTWAVFGYHDYYNGSPRTRHLDFTVRRT